MPSVCLYFQVHQPSRIKRYGIFDIGLDHDYFNGEGEGNFNNRWVMNKVAQKCYLPANEIILSHLQNFPEFKVSFSFSGVVLEQMEKFAPAVLESFKKIFETGRAEILSETYHHSLSFFYSKREFESQVLMHKDLVRKIFGVEPEVFRNTELAYTNDLADWADLAGYTAILAEGWDDVLGWRSPNFVYRPTGTQNIKLLLKNYKLSDDVAFRFSESSWSEWPLTASKYTSWISSINGSGDVVNLFMDYETFGEHQWESAGIFDFFRALPKEILTNSDNNFMTPSEVAKKYPFRDFVDCERILTWADTERDLSAWTGNEIQKEAIKILYNLEERVLNANDAGITSDWRYLQTSDHFYYMCTKWFNDGDVHAYFNPYSSPYEAFISYMNVVNDLKLRLGAKNV